MSRGRRLSGVVRLAAAACALALVSCQEVPKSAELRQPVGLSCPANMDLVYGGVYTFGSHSALDAKGETTGEPYEAERVELPPFCIDRYPWPNRRREVPLRAVSWFEARAKCLSVGKVLCTEYQWEAACRGPWGWQFPYGETYQPGRCPEGNLAKPYRPGERRENGYCASGFGTMDMAGGYWEWTANTVEDDTYDMFERSGTPARVQRGGADFTRGPEGFSCFQRRAVSVRRFDAKTTFRCCAPPLKAGETTPNENR